jgi:hypothetical protein
MANASELLSGPRFTELGSNSADGTGWLIDPDLNTNGVTITTLCASAEAGGHVGRVGSDKATPGNNRLLYGQTVTGSHSLQNIKLAPGEGLYVTGGGAVTFDYL